MQTVQVKREFNVLDVTSGWPISYISAGPFDDIIVASRGQTDSVRVHQVTAEGSVRVIDLPCPDGKVSHVQPMPSNQWLLVSSIARAATDRNASIYSEDGRLLNSFHAGDAIEDVQTAADGSIWISYFDEGVFGHLPLSNSGLVCLDPQGTRIFDYFKEADRRGVATIADCYALNVCSVDEVWLHYYTDFPLVRLVDKGIDRVWSDIPVHGAKCLAVGGGQVILGGGYAGITESIGSSWPSPLVSRSGSLVSLTLDTMKAEDLELVDEAETPVGFSTAFARESRLYMLADGSSLFSIEAGGAL